MHRKEFLKKSAALSIAAALPISANNLTTLNKRQKSYSHLKPPKLNKGDTLGLIAPGSFINEDELNESIENLENLDFKVKYFDSILDRDGYLAGTDKRRADEINKMFADTKVNGIVCARGGYGCNRILDSIDYEMIKQNPKVLVGYSDITALLYAIYSKTGLVCFHGPVGISTFSDFSVRYFEDTLVNPQSGLVLNSFSEDEDGNKKSRYIIRSGIAEGELIGGNLSVLTSIIGSDYDLDYTGKIVFLEEVGEEPYRIDRMLTQLLLAGHLKKSAGIALGVFKNCEVKKRNASFNTSFSLAEVLYDRLFNLGIPVIYGLSFGHIENKFTLPVGIKARLDVTNETLRLLESPVI
jgi:muramoyltetrapeptide carboxypeptidase